MTRLLKACRKYREDVCAVASGDLPPEDRAGLEKHVGACAGCQRYRDEIRNVAALLAAGREQGSGVEPRETTQRRWTREFEAAVEPAPFIAARVFRGFIDWSRDMVWPYRRLWAGLAAIWVVILGLNTWLGATDASHGASPEMMRALLAREGFLAGGTAEDREAKPPTPPSAQPGSKRPHHSNSI
jgi:hypothetical protein